MAVPAAIQSTVKLYFDGLYRSDTGLLRRAFHPSAMIIGYASDGKLATMTLADFLAFVETVPSHEADGVPYNMEILSVDVTGTVASVKVRDLYLNRMFTDYLHLIETDDGWQIIGKAFHSIAHP